MTSQSERLSGRERARVVGLSLGFLVVFGFLFWVFWNFHPAWDQNSVWDGFWEPIQGGGRRVPKGVVVLYTLAFYFVVVPAAFLVFVAGVVQGLRGRRTRVARWILRASSSRQARRDVEARGAVYIPTWVGVALVVGLPLIILLLAVFAS
ncbi:MAG: hypothetical protein J2P46_09200 [Zavarzinella sp.]|nr:hypothetical protein [Zavarzinella sp.]